MGTLPFALVGGLWLLFLLGYNLVDRIGHRFYRIGRRFRGIRHRDADLSGSRDPEAAGETIYGGLCRESSLHEERDAETSRSLASGRKRKGFKHFDL
jgi:hypothetical protein